MEKIKYFICVLLSILLISTNIPSLAQTCQYSYKDSTKFASLMDYIKQDVYNNNFTKLKIDYTELSNNILCSKLSQENKNLYLNSLNNTLKEYYNFEKSKYRKQQAALEIKNIYKEFYLKDKRFKDVYIENLELYLNLIPTSYYKLCSVMDLMDLYIISLKNNDFSKLDKLMELYRQYNQKLISDTQFKYQFRNNLSETINMLKQITCEWPESNNLQYLNYIASSYEFLADTFSHYDNTEEKQYLYYLKQAENIYYEINAIDADNPTILKKLVDIYFKISADYNAPNEYKHSLIESIKILERLKELSKEGLCETDSYALLMDTYMRIGIYYYQREKNNLLAEQYFNKAINEFECSMKKLGPNEKADNSILLLYLNVCNFYADIDNYKKVAIYKARSIEIFKTYIYAHNPSRENTFKLLELKLSYATSLYNIRQDDKARLILESNIQTIKNYIKEHPDSKSQLEYFELPENLKLLGHVYYYKSNFPKAAQLLTQYANLKQKNTSNKNIYYYQSMQEIYQKIVFAYQHTGNKTQKNIALNKMKLINQQIIKLKTKK